MTRDFELLILGPPELRHKGKVQRGFRSKKSLLLLSYLIVTGQAASRSYLADSFWGDKSETRGRANLSSAIHDITSTLPGCIRADRRIVQFQPNKSLHVDVVQFKQLVGEETATAQEHALQLYRGEFLMGVSPHDSVEIEAWLMAERERWNHTVSDVLQSVVQHYSECGEYKHALERARQLERLEPWREEVHRQIMRFLALQGRRSEALRQYKQCIDVLEAELDVKPSESTTELYEQIRDGLFSPNIDVTTPTKHSLSDRFLDREEEHAVLARHWQRVLMGHGKLTLIEGEAGSGKTRLVKEVLRSIVDRNVLSLRTRCYKFGQATAYQPIAAALREGLSELDQRGSLPQLWEVLSSAYVAELAQLIPEVYEMYGELPDTRDSSRHAGPLQLFEAITRCFEAFVALHDAVILFVDDLQWADEATINLVNYLFDRLHDLPIWFIGAYQGKQMDVHNPLLLLRRTKASENNLLLITLTPLSTDVIFRELHSMPGIDTELAQSLAEFLGRTSGGNPLILSHYLEYLQGKGILDSILQNPQDTIEKLAHVDIPFTVRETLLSQVVHLSSSARELLELLTVMGPEFDPRVVQIVTDSQMNVRELLQELFQHGIISVQTPTVYAFSNSLLQEVMYDSIPGWRLRLIHHEIASALERLHEEERDRSVIEEIAYHYRHSGNTGRARQLLLSLPQG